MIPAPFVVALLLAILAARIARHSEESWSRNTLLAAVGVCAALATLVGLRWSYDLPFARFAQPIVASALPGIAWFGFGGLRGSQGWSNRSSWPHALPIVVVALLAFFWRPLLDLGLVTLFLGYGIALLRIARRGADSMSGVRLGDEIAAYRATLMVGGLLVASGLIELAIAADFSFARGNHAAEMVATENVLMLALVGYAAAVADRSRPAAEMASAQQATDQQPILPIRGQSPQSDPGDASVLAAFEAAMRDRKLYRDPNMTLDRLARRMGIPARQISAAVNRFHGRNVSQVVNEYRVAEATRLLREKDLPVTEIMLEAGFQTKSNFNREFKRVMGLTPSGYREAAMLPPESG